MAPTKVPIALWPYRIYSRLEAPLILQLRPPRRRQLFLPPDVGVHVLEGRRGRRHPQLGAPQLVQLREDLVLRHAQLLRVARGQAQEVVVAGLKEMEK